MDPSFRYATNHYDTDGVETDWDISFSGGYISEAHVGAYSVVVDAETGLESDRTEHALVFLSETVVRIAPAVPADRKLYLYRDTPKTDIIVSFANGRVLNKANLDLANRQAIFGLAELVDALSAAQITVNQQTGNVIDLAALIQQVYDAALAILASSGAVSVLPRVWSGVGDGVTTDFPLAGADLTNPGFYDTYLNGVGLDPSTSFSIVSDGADRYLRFTTAPANAAPWFTVLRGFARPYIGDPPVTDLSIPVFSSAASLVIADGAFDRGIVEMTSVVPSSFRLKTIPPTGTGLMKRGSVVSVLQSPTAGQVTLQLESGTFVLPTGYAAKTRAPGSTVVASCLSADENRWLLTGDLALA